MVRPAPDLLARPAVCGHPTGMILTRAPSRAPFALVVKITPGPQPALVRQSALRPLRFAPTIGSPSRSLRVGSCTARATDKHIPPRPLSRRGKSAAHPARKDRVGESRSLSYPRRPDPYPQKKDRCSSISFVLYSSKRANLMSPLFSSFRLLPLRYFMRDLEQREIQLYRRLPRHG